MNVWIVNLTGLALLALIVWWFWFLKPPAQRALGKDPIEILVNNGVYTPARIEVPIGQPVVLRFMRRDPSPCAEQAVFEELGVSATLPLDKPIDVQITAPRPGEYEFSCQMHMYRGTLVAR